jgi:hypothetical protein
VVSWLIASDEQQILETCRAAGSGQSEIVKAALAPELLVEQAINCEHIDSVYSKLQDFRAASYPLSPAAERLVETYDRGLVELRAKDAGIHSMSSALSTLVARYCADRDDGTKLYDVSRVFEITGKGRECKPDLKAMMWEKWDKGEDVSAARSGLMKRSASWGTNIDLLPESVQNDVRGTHRACTEHL